MNSEHKVVAVVVACLAAVVIGIVAATAVYNITQQNDISQDIAHGASPMAAGCAHNAISGQSEAACVRLP